MTKVLSKIKNKITETNAYHKLKHSTFFQNMKMNLITAEENIKQKLKDLHYDLDEQTENFREDIKNKIADLGDKANDIVENKFRPTI